MSILPRLKSTTSSPPLPPDYTSPTRLGKKEPGVRGQSIPLATYRAARLRWQDFWLLFLPGALAILLPMVYSWNTTIDAYTHYGPAAVEASSELWVLLSLGALLIFAPLFIWRLSRSLLKVELYAEGLKIHRPFHFTLWLPWEEITGIASSSVEESFGKRVIRTRQFARLYPAHGFHIRFDDRLEHLTELITQVKAHLYPRRLTQMRAAFIQGECITCGPVAIQKQSLFLRGRPTAWTNVQHITVLNGSLVIESIPSTTTHIPIGQIPNLELLLKLIQEGVNL